MATIKLGACVLKSTLLNTRKVKRLFGWMGTICLFLIISVKAIRWVDASMASTIVVGIIPSVLGPPGLLFLILSSSGRLSRLTLVQVTLLVTVIALGLELIQLVPRPSILAKVHYTFDWFDVIASGISVCVGYLVALFMTNEKGKKHDVVR